jgi:hypothetical protein
MTTRLEQYMNQLLATGARPYAGFLGAYNLGVWGLSVSDQRPFEQGLVVSGAVLEKAPRTLAAGAELARNEVRFYDTPNLWGFGDDGPLRTAIEHARGVLGISRGSELGETDRRRIQAYLKTHSGLEWDGSDRPWSEIATRREVQQAMDARGAWSELVGRWKAVVAQSRFLVDITSLSPPLTGSEVQLQLCEGIGACVKRWIEAASKDAATTPRLMIRILFGMTATKLHGTGANTHWKEFKEHLARTLSPLRRQVLAVGAKRPPMVLYGSDMGRIPANFNHSKIVAGDGQYALVGGHNMCEEVSSNTAPVIHDITAEVTGPGALTANAFAGSLWMKAAENGRLFIHAFGWQTDEFVDLSDESPKLWAPENLVAYARGSQEGIAKVLGKQYWHYPMQDLPSKPEVDAPAGSVPAVAVMGIGRWGDTDVFGVKDSGGLRLNKDIPAQQACQYASDYLKRLLIDDPANTAIRMSQQDLVNDGLFGGAQRSEHTICELLGKRLKATPKGTAIEIVVSSRFSQNSEGLAYSYGDGPREAAERISDTVSGVAQRSSTRGKWPKRLAALDLEADLPAAEVSSVSSAADPSFCTIAPLAFCEARGTTRARGSYAWPDAKYAMEKLYTSGRFWNDDDKRDLKFGPGNHAKVMFVSDGDDDATGLVMIGSDNMYPSPLSEFNFVLEGPEVIAAFRDQYWDRLWRYSARLGFTVKADGAVT